MYHVALYIIYTIYIIYVSNIVLVLYSNSDYLHLKRRESTWINIFSWMIIIYYIEFSVNIQSFPGVFLPLEKKSLAETSRNFEVKGVKVFARRWSFRFWPTGWNLGQTNQSKRTWVCLRLFFSPYLGWLCLFFCGLSLTFFWGTLFWAPDFEKWPWTSIDIYRLDVHELLFSQLHFRWGLARHAATQS